jgi:4-hydroxy-2-oxoheptanedioate aldolase
MLRRNFLKEKLAQGQAVIGTWSIIPSVVVTDIIASTKIDFIIIDSEHGPINFETAQNMVITCESRKVSPVMRVGGIIEADILKALDIGVHCVQIPNITTKRDIEKLIELVKYPPLGSRGFSPFTRAGNYSSENSKELVKAANENVLLAVHIEGKEAVDNIDEILKINELDIIFIGLFDISKSLGIPGEVNNLEILEILEKMANQINTAGKYPGTIVNSFDQLKKFLNYGIKYITYSVDCEILSSGYKQINANFRALNNNYTGRDI